jgi:membrane protein DedA with SNARE-associated domain
MAMELHGLIEHYSHHPDLLFFVAAVVGGQEMILPLAFLVGEGFWNIPHLFAVTFVATIAVDLFWFGLARLGRRWKWLQNWIQRDGKVKRFAQRMSKNEASLLFMTKFILGTRVVSVLYLSLEGLKVFRFMLLNILVTIPWLAIVIGIGWLAGRGSTFFGNLMRHPVLLTIGVVSLVLLFQWGKRILERKVLEPETQTTPELP